MEQAPKDMRFSSRGKKGTNFLLCSPFLGWDVFGLRIRSGGVINAPALLLGGLHGLPQAVNTRITHWGHQANYLSRVITNATCNTNIISVINWGETWNLFWRPAQVWVSCLKSVAQINCVSKWIGWVCTETCTPYRKGLVKTIIPFKCKTAEGCVCCYGATCINADWLSRMLTTNMWGREKQIFQILLLTPSKSYKMIPFTVFLQKSQLHQGCDYYRKDWYYTHQSSCEMGHK